MVVGSPPRVWFTSRNWQPSDRFRFGAPRLRRPQSANSRPNGRISMCFPNSRTLPTMNSAFKALQRILLNLQIYFGFVLCCAGFSPGLFCQAAQNEAPKVKDSEKSKATQKTKGAQKTKNARPVH